MFTNKNKQPDPNGQQLNLLHHLLKATARTNQLLCSIRDGQTARPDDPGIKPLESSLKSVIDAGMPQEIATQNPDRAELWICNVSDKDLLIGPQSADINDSLYSAAIKPSETFRIHTRDNRLYRESIFGVWQDGAKSGSKAMITEFFQPAEAAPAIDDDQ